MSAKNIVMGAAGTADKTYIEDVFSTYLYNGTGATQTINNGIDLAGKGGMIWIKTRTQGATGWVHVLFDTARGANKFISSNLTNAQNSAFTDTLTGFNSNGFSLGADASTYLVNQTGYGGYASWTFRKAPKFFDVVTFTYDPAIGYPGKTISHNLGSTPGMVIVKSTTLGTGGGASWYVGHRATATPYIDTLFLSTTAAASAGNSNINTVTDTTFNFLGGGTAGVSETYVAYLFAHDTTTDGLIQCGSYTGTGTTNNVTLGWEPQYVLIKSSSQAANWVQADNMRGFPDIAGQHTLFPNTSDAEAQFQNQVSPTSTGFKLNGEGTQFNQSGQTYIYMAIRRGPMRTPTDGTKVFQSLTRTGTGTLQTISTTPSVDLVISGRRTNPFGSLSQATFDRLRGASQVLYTGSTNVEATKGDTFLGFDVSNGYRLGTDGNDNGINTSGTSYVNWLFRRAPGFFDVVCFTSSGSPTTTFKHNLGVKPELVIIKSRSSSTWPEWFVGNIYSPNQYNDKLELQTTAGYQLNDGTIYSATTTDVTTYVSMNSPGVNYVAYLFASCPGVSKVGTYTGNGSSQTINCGFSAGARFVLIKRTDSTGDWYVWDTARGIVAATDPHLSLNTTAAEVTTDDTIDPDSTGFIVNQVTATNVNVSGATYIYLAIA